MEEWAETQFHNSGVLGKPTLSIYIPPSKPSKHARSLDDGEPTLALHLLPDVMKRIILLPIHIGIVLITYDGAENTGWVSAASAHYVDVDAADWTLPEEAFPLRSAPPPPHALGAHTTPAPAAPPHTLRHDDKDHTGQWRFCFTQYYRPEYR